jgi:putative spermidine/putrescine transport system ATP-binding protein
MTHALVRGLNSGPAQAGPRDLDLEGIERSFGTIRAVKNIDISVKAGEFLTLLGPSGCGKTTLLKMVAGFDFPSRGRIVLGGEDVTGKPPARRNIGMVFQNYALFPHMSVAKNIAFPLEMRKVSRAEIDKRVADALNAVALPQMGERLPRQLSGGQQQRIALARAIVFNPGLLLLDEPFGALDRKLREHMHLEVKHLHERLGLTMLFVTHDQEEALLLSDRIAVMLDGEIIQVGTPAEIYGRPLNKFVASFVGESNLLEGVYLGGGEVALTSGQVIAVATTEGEPEGAVSVLIRPEALRFLTPEEIADNRFEVTVVEKLYLGQSTKFRLALNDGAELLVRSSAGRTRPDPQAGERVVVGCDRADARCVR